MIHQWVNACLKLSRQKADLYSGCRKIIRQTSLDFNCENDLALRDAGYTSAKMRYLERAYLHPESHAVAQQLWKRRVEQAKYGSVGFTCYNHFIKNDPNNKSKRASVMGPCIQAVTLTYLNKKESVAVDVFYRTTELLKKFPADLVFLRDVLLPPFNLVNPTITCHFANITIHPMYFVTIIPHLITPIYELQKIAVSDKYFHDWVVKWSARYLCPEYHRGIQKFAQAMRVHKDAMERIDKTTLKAVQKYLCDVHPGYRNEYDDPDEDSDL